MAIIEELNKTRARFYTHEEEVPNETAAQGRPIFKTIERVKLTFIGDPRTELHALANEQFMQRPGGHGMITYAEAFPDEYAAFKAGQDVAATGTPISMLPLLRANRAAELKALKVTTIEDLASLGPNEYRRIGPDGSSLVEQAKDYIEEADKSAVAKRFSDENEELRAQIMELKSRMDAKETPADEFSDWSDDQLRDFLGERGVSLRKNASRDKLVEAVREMREAA